MRQRDVMVVAAARPAIGRFGGGALSDMQPCDLGGAVIKKAVGRVAGREQELTMNACTA